MLFGGDRPLIRVGSTLTLGLGQGSYLALASGKRCRSSHTHLEPTQRIILAQLEPECFSEGYNRVRSDHALDSWNRDQGCIHVFVNGFQDQSVQGCPFVLSQLG